MFKKVAVWPIEKCLFLVRSMAGPQERICASRRHLGWQPNAAVGGRCSMGGEWGCWQLRHLAGGNLLPGRRPYDPVQQLLALGPEVGADEAEVQQGHSKIVPRGCGGGLPRRAGDRSSDPSAMDEADSDLHQGGDLARVQGLRLQHHGHQPVGE